MEVVSLRNKWFLFYIFFWGWRVMYEYVVVEMESCGDNGIGSGDVQYSMWRCSASGEVK